MLNGKRSSTGPRSDPFPSVFIRGYCLVPPRGAMPALTLLLGFLLIAGSLGCEGPRQEAPLDNASLNAGLDPKNPRILALVDYFEAQGIELVHDSGGWWRVTRPAPPEFDVIVSLRSFPERASAYQMRDALSRINLAYLLNADARVAMSYPGLRGARPGATTDFRIRELQTRLERLFQAYRAGTPLTRVLKAGPPSGSLSSMPTAPAEPAPEVCGPGHPTSSTSSSPRHVAIRAVFRYDPETEAWERLALEPLPSATLTVASPRQIYFSGKRPGAPHHSFSSRSLLGTLGGRRAPPCQCDLCGADAMRGRDARSRAARSVGYVRPIRRPSRSAVRPGSLPALAAIA